MKIQVNNRVWGCEKQDDSDFAEENSDWSLKVLVDFKLEDLCCGGIKYLIDGITKDLCDGATEDLVHCALYNLIRQINALMTGYINVSWLN